MSDEASIELQRIIENIALDIAKRAAQFAGDSARLKVSAKDVRSGMKEMFEMHQRG